MKRGFTLIELLAVIVILAIIAVIAVPIVINIIEESKENATLRSADFYLDAVEMSVAQATLKNQNVPDGTYNILDSGNICLSYDSENKCIDELKVEVNGEVPEIGIITITGGEVSSLNIKLNEKEIYKNSKGELEYVKTLDEVCEIINGTPQTIGSKYNCKVDPNKDDYTFYVLSYNDENGNIITDKTNAKSINLIMDSNINISGESVKSDEMEDKGFTPWINEEDYVLAGGDAEEYNFSIEPGLFGNNSKGPITAMNHLHKATKSWTNLEPIIVNTFTDVNGTIHDMSKIYTTCARMPHYFEVTFNGNNGFLADNLKECTYADVYEDENGFHNIIKSCSPTDYQLNFLDGVDSYWTSSFQEFFAAFFVNFDLTDYNATGVSSSMGVRPVITLKLN